MEQLNKEGFLKQIFNYEEKENWDYQGKMPCLIDFHDDSCAPCQSIAPIIKELAEDYDGKVLFYKVDAPTEDDLVKELGVNHFPTLVLCPVDDKPVVFQGAASRERIKDAIDQELLGEPE